MTNLEPVLGGDDTIRRNFSKLQDLFTKTAALISNAFDGSTSQTAPAQARVYNSANIPTVDNTVKTLTFNSERWDTGNYHSTSSNTDRLTAPTAGLYAIGIDVQWAANVTGIRLVRIQHSSGTIIARDIRGAVAGTGEAEQCFSTTWQMAAGEYVFAEVFQLSGGALNVTALASSSPEFWIVRVGSST